MCCLCSFWCCRALYDDRIAYSRVLLLAFFTSWGITSGFGHIGWCPNLANNSSEVSLGGRRGSHGCFGFWQIAFPRFGHLLGKGTSGPVPTIRSEAFRENIQEAEARISIEEGLLDEGKKARLGDDLAARCRALLDERIRVCLHAHGPGLPWFVSSGWKERTEELFRLAGEVAKALEDE